MLAKMRFYYLFIPAVLFVSGQQQAAKAFQPQGVLSSLQEVHDRLRKNDTNDYTIDLKASVNHWDRSWKSLFVQDGDAAGFVELPQQDYSQIPDLNLGDVLHIKGTFNPSQYILQATSIKKLSAGEPATVLDFPIADAPLETHWSRRVQVQGVVETVLVRSSRLQMIVRAGARRFFVRAQGADDSEVPSAGSLVVLTGTLSCLIDENGKSYAYVVHQMPDDRRQIFKASEPHKPIDVSDYTQLSADSSDDAGEGSSGVFVYEVHGQVSYVQGYAFAIVENRKGQSLQVYAPFEGDLHVGDLVRIVGTKVPGGLGEDRERSPLRPGYDSLGVGTDLISQKVIVSTAAPLPAPPSYSVEQIFETKVRGIRAEVSGSFLSSRQTGDDWEVLIGTQDQYVSCLIPQEVFDAGKLNLHRALEIQAVGLLQAPEAAGGPYLLRVKQLSDIRVTQKMTGIDHRIALAVLAGLLLLILVSVTVLRAQVNRKERALSRLASRLESSYQAISEGLLVVDQKGVIVGANARLLELLGLEDGELEKVSGSMEAIGGVLASRFHGDEFLEFWDRSNQHPRIAEQRVFATVDSVSRTLVANTTVVQDTYGAVDARIWTFDDVTSQKRLEANLIQGQKMEALGRLVGGVAHDFNNFLSAILANLELLRLHPQQQVCQVMEYLDEADDAVERASELVKRLMSFSRKSELKMRARSVNEVVRQTCALLKRSMNSLYRLEVDLADDVRDTMIDENQVVQVLLNICLNARDAMAPDGGTIRISTSNVCASELNSSPLLMSNESGSDDLEYVRIRIRDEGEGIPSAIRAKIFEPFFTTKPQGEGTGLGLATSKGIIEQHGGDIVCDSSVHEGACFDILLPTAREAALV